LLHGRAGAKRKEIRPDGNEFSRAYAGIRA
jgi:hypothetical protein